MLLVKTKIGVSKIHGLGLFADQFIPKGTVTWEYNSIFDVAFTEEEINSLAEIPRKAMLHYTYFDKELGKYILCGDDQRFINHTKENANISSSVRRDVAARDIKAGEEFLCDYRLFDDSYFPRIGLKDEDLK